MSSHHTHGKDQPRAQTKPGKKAAKVPHVEVTDIADYTTLYQSDGSAADGNANISNRDVSWCRLQLGG